MRRRIAAVGSTLAILVAGVAARAADRPSLAASIWVIGATVMGAPLVVRTIRGMAEGRVATDIVASLSIIGAIVLGQPLAALVIVVTQLGGDLLQRAAEHRASGAVQELEARVPHAAQMMRMARSSQAPMQRAADRYATWFTPIVVTIGATAVGLTHDWTRALAILVVATPCPLVLATPVAIVGGLGRAAKRLIVIRTAGTLERLADIDCVVFDKTGTVTVGQPSVRAVRVAPGFDRNRVLGYAAAIERHSTHLLAGVLVDAVVAEGIRVPVSRRTVESRGLGVSGIVESHRVSVGARAFIVPQCRGGSRSAEQLESPEGSLRSYVSIGNELAAVVEYADEIRPELEDVLQRLRRCGVRHHAIVSGDHGPAVEALALRLAVDDAYGDLLPRDKARFVTSLQARGHVVMMVGDAITDGPALSVADVGAALVSDRRHVPETVDVVLLGDSLNGIHDAIQISRRTLRIARQSIWTGLGLSAVAMLVAAFGGLSPIIGAAIQEAIDVSIILNALRSSVENGRSLSSMVTHAAHSARGDSRVAWPRRMSSSPALLPHRSGKSRRDPGARPTSSGVDRG